MLIFPKSLWAFWYSRDKKSTFRYHFRCSYAWGGGLTVSTVHFMTSISQLRHKILPHVHNQQSANTVPVPAAARSLILVRAIFFSACLIPLYLPCHLKHSTIPVRQWKRYKAFPRRVTPVIKEKKGVFVGTLLYRSTLFARNSTSR